ncbi:MAG: DUF2065 domain-containing protein [Gammaproteobacteria bacterium]|nr:DUF2065 domain-containing protein [Gammaproteobacteria bacterium]TVQ46742.1 MAG: DUF2065 domain-containing protein [Gammaproteobacteria bacterium]
MLWTDLLAAFALYLVLEGLLPFASPQRWRRSLLVIGQLSDRELRIGGLVIMLAGLLLLYAVRG